MNEKKGELGLAHGHNYDLGPRYWTRSSNGGTNGDTDFAGQSIQKADERNVSRRDIATKLLVGVGLLGVASCVPADDRPASSTEQSLTGANFLWADTLTDLRGIIGSDTATTSKPVAVMGGYSAVGDGGGGVFYWDKSASTGDNGGTIVVPTGSSTGRWVRVFTGPISVRWFGAKGNGTIDDTTAIQNTIAACSAKGGGVVFLPNGTYIVSNPGTVHDAGCLAMVSSVDLLGESREGTVIKLAANQVAQTRPIMVYNVSDVSIRHLSIDGNKAGNPDNEEHRAGIFTVDCNRVDLADLNIYNCTGDAVDVYGESTGTQDLTVERCYFHDNLRKAISMNATAKRVSFRDCVWQNNAGELFIESGTVFDLLIEHCLIDQNTGNGGYVLSLGGLGDGSRSVGLVCQNCVINGPVQVIYAESVRIQNCRITPTNSDGTPPLAINGDVLDCVVDACTLTLPSQGVGGGNGLVYIAGNFAEWPHSPRKIRITNNRLNNGHVIENTINITNTDDVLISHNEILSTSSNHGGAAIAISATDATKPLPTIGTIMVVNNYMFDFAYGIVVGGGVAGKTIQALTISNNVFEKGTNTNALVAWSLQDPNRVLQSASVYGNDVRGYSAFDIIPGSGGQPIPILIGGTRGTSGGSKVNGFGIYSVYGTPNGLVTESPGAIAMSYAGGANLTFYVKESGVNTNTGWVAK